MKFRVYTVISILLFHLFTITSQQCQDENFNVQTMPKTNQRTWNVQTDTRRQLVLRIKGNLSSGNEWYISHPLLISRKTLIPLNVSRTGKTTEFLNDVSASGERLTRNAGYYYFRFQAVRKGKVALKFVFKNEDDDVENTMNVNLTIR
jgi:hypothetical protein